MRSFWMLFKLTAETKSSLFRASSLFYVWILLHFQNAPIKVLQDLGVIESRFLAYMSATTIGQN